MCVNQRGIEERNSQVGQMQDIYLSAKRVTVGHEEGTAKMVLTLCRKIQEDTEQHRGTHGQYLAIPNEIAALRACCELFSRP